MILADSEIRRSLDAVSRAFPRFSVWDYNNEIDDLHQGFSIWGEFVPDPDEDEPPRFFVTFVAHQAIWRGYLTVGKHAYYWSSADSGDAYLLDTGACISLEDAITRLQRKITSLFEALSGRYARPGRRTGGPSDPL